MRTTITLLLIFIISTTTWAQTISRDPYGADRAVMEMLNSGSYYDLEAAYPRLRNSIATASVRLMAEAILGSHFNRPAEASRAIIRLIDEYPEQLNVNNVIDLMSMWAINQLTLGNYGAIHSRLSWFTRQYADALGYEETRQFDFFLRISAALKDQPETTMQKSDSDNEIPIRFQSVGDGVLLMAPATVNGKEREFIIDTGYPFFNIVSGAFARQNDIRIITHDPIPIRGVRPGYAKLGIADTFVIGGTTFRNAVFLVEEESFKQYVTGFTHEAVLGNGILMALGEIHILPSENKAVFPVEGSPKPPTGKNLLFFAGQPYIRLGYGELQVVFNLDTGSAGSYLSAGFYNNYRKLVEETGKFKKTSNAGLGGIVSTNVYILPEIKLNLGGREIKIKNIEVETQKGFASMMDETGSLGADFITGLNSLIIDYNQMFIKAE